MYYATYIYNNIKFIMFLTYFLHYNKYKTDLRIINLHFVRNLYFKYKNKFFGLDKKKMKCNKHVNLIDVNP
jgi:hypothetical protein